MALLTNPVYPTEAIPGERIDLSIDLSVGTTLTGEGYNVVWAGNAPGMPYSETVGFGANLFGEDKTLYFGFIMPEWVIRFRVLASDTDWLFVDRVSTPEFIIVPAKATYDPGKKPGGIFDWLGGIGTWLSGGLVYIILGLLALITFVYVLKKKAKPKL